MANEDERSRFLRMALPRDGVATVQQATESGLTVAQIKHLVRSGILDRPERGVVRVVGVPSTWMQGQRIAALRAGSDAATSHRSAARLLQLDGSEWPQIELTGPLGHRRRPRRGRLYESTDLERRDLVSRHGLWVTNATRTLVDLGAVVSEAQLEMALDDALRRGLTTHDRLWTAIARLGRPGRSGVPQLRDLLVGRGDVEGLTDTGFETLLLRALRHHGLPRPTTQHELFDDDGEFVMRFDAAYLVEKVGVEADSKRWHGTDSRFESDREQRAVATALGWSVIPVTWRQVTTRPAWVGETVARTLVVAARRAA